MIRTAIVDDDAVFCAFAEQCIAEYAAASGIEIETEVYFSSEDFFAHCGSGFDLILLDIELGGMNGIEAGERLRRAEQKEQAQILYISAKESYAMELFHNRPFDFLVKPVSKERLFAALQEYVRVYDANAEFFVFTHERKRLRVPASDILYFQSNRKKLIVAAVHECIEVYEKLETVLQSPQGSRFLRIHRCYAVNPQHITAFSYEEVTLTNGERLGISRSLRQSVSERLLAAAHLRMLEGRRIP